MDTMLLIGRRTGDFLWGDYKGAPIDYLMAIAFVYAAMVVLVARNLIHAF